MSPSGLAPGSRTPGDPELAAALRRLPRTSLLVVGDAMLDRYIFGQVTRVSMEAPVPILCVEREVASPGGAGNVVRNLTALGAAVAFVSVVGDDQPGADLTGLVGRQPGVEPWLLVQGGRVTTRKTRYVAHGQQLLRADREQVDPVHPKLADRLVRIAREAMAATSVTVLSDYGKGVLAGDVPAQLIAAARTAGRKVIVDPRGSDYARYAGADVIVPTWRELSAATGMPADTDDAVAAASARLRQQHDVGAVVVMRGEAGISLHDGAVRHFAVELGEVFDLSGVNDAVVAALAAGIVGGLPLERAVQLATVAAGVVAGKVGTAVAQSAELLAALGE